MPWYFIYPYHGPYFFKTIEVFDFGDGGGDGLSRLRIVDEHVDVGLEADVALLHDALGHAQVSADIPQRAASSKSLPSIKPLSSKPTS